MKKFWIWMGVLLFVVGLGVVTFWNVPTWRLYDKDWRPLAMTHAENYCSAKIGLDRSFMEDDPKVKACMEDSHLNNTIPSIAKSTDWACSGIRDAGLSLSLAACRDIIEGNQLWMIAGGGLASKWSWSDSHPRPESIQEGVLPSDTRTNRGGDEESLPGLGEG
jgi:hypothetical protein